MKSKLLEKMQMPGSKKIDEMEASEPGMELDMVEGEAMADESEMESGELQSFSDEELMAEFKKRGLKLDAASDMDSEEDDQEVYS